ncbi:MAG: RNA-binding domain-containing protein [Candidatus Njordarchaeia archaeon]
MKKKIAPTKLIIHVHVHSTESKEKVLKAIENTLPPNVPIDKFDISEEHFTGHHGNPITRIELQLSKKRDVNLVFTHIFKKIEWPTYSGWIEERFDTTKNKLFLRIDKQRAYLGEIHLSSGDNVIQLIFSFPRFPPFTISDLEEVLSELRKKPSE